MLQCHELTKAHLGNTQLRIRKASERTGEKEEKEEKLKAKAERKTGDGFAEDGVTQDDGATPAAPASGEAT